MSFDDARRRMVHQIETRGVHDPAVLAAMGKVPRERFVGSSLTHAAYEDRPLPIGEGQTISQPYIVALMTEALRLTSRDRVLEIGTGSGYAAAVLAEIAAQVYTIERLGSLAASARRRLSDLGYETVHVRCADGTLGWPEHAPYDAIVVTAGGPEIPKALLDQLAIGGRLVMPVGALSSGQHLVRVVRTGPDDYDSEDLGGVAFVPLIGAEGWPEDGGRLMTAVIEALAQPPVAARRVELVERKGLGHPDSICDALVETIAIALNRMYRERTGAILHYNIDKALLVAGQCVTGFGRGEVIRPMTFYVGDRATFEADGVKLPVEDTLHEAVEAWLATHLPRVRPGQDFQVRSVLAPGSVELRGVVTASAGAVASNDTSGASGHAPLSPTEQTVLAVERFLNGPAFKARFPDTGEDVKVFGVREDDRLRLTVAMPLVCVATASEAAYFARKDEILAALAAEFRDVPLALEWRLNNLDARGRGADGDLPDRDRHVRRARRFRPGRTRQSRQRPDRVRAPVRGRSDRRQERGGPSGQDLQRAEPSARGADPCAVPGARTKSTCTSWRASASPSIGRGRACRSSCRAASRSATSSRRSARSSTPSSRGCPRSARSCCAARIPSVEPREEVAMATQIHTPTARRDGSKPARARTRSPSSAATRSASCSPRSWAAGMSCGRCSCWRAGRSR